MFLDFFLKLRDSKIPVTLREYLSFLEGFQLDIVQFDINKFYYLARTSLVKDEKLIDRFDIVFGNYFNSLDQIEIDDVLKQLSIPNTWLKKLFERYFSKEEMDKVKSQGDYEKLIEKFKKRLNEQKKRHQGGNKWIGTSGTSPFGAYGYNPEGIRIGQSESRYKSAIKVWDKRNFKDFDDRNELNSRGFKIALKRLRQWARTGVNEELDLEETIKDTAKNGYLDIKMRKEKENSIKLLLFLDVGGSMDEHIIKVESLFSAAKNVFKNFKHFYFHNCLYEGVWQNNSRRWEERFSTEQILRTYGREYKCIFVGDASMSPYEILMPGGGNEHFNEITGKAWLEKALYQWPSHLWINPIPKRYWKITDSIKIINDIFHNKMVPLSIKGIEQGTEILSKKHY